MRAAFHQTLRSGTALVLLAGLGLAGCDQAIDDRYGGLVVAPIQEVILVEEEEAEQLANADLPAPRPDRIPARADQAIALNTEEVDDTELDLELALNTPVVDLDAPLLLEDPSFEGEDLEIAESLETVALAENEALVPKARADVWPRSFDELDAFLAAQVEEEQRIATEEAAALAAAQEAERQAEAERLAALEAEQRAQREAEEAAALIASQTVDPVATIAVSVPRPLATASLLLPLSYEDGAALRTPEELKVFYADQSFDLTRVIAGGPVPGLILQRLPKDLGELNSTDRALLKEIYIKATLPLCLVANERVLIERDHVLSREDVREDLSLAIDPAVRGLAAKYGTLSRRELLERLDTVPVSLCLAQAILESRWGLSEVTTDQNSLFGPWAQMEGSLIPAAEATETAEELKTFATLQASADAYVLHLNRSEALAEFREARADAMRDGTILSGSKAAAHIQAFDTQTPNYGILIQRLIEENELDQYDLARLGFERTAVPVL